MITCSIRYEIDLFRVDAFAEYARAWGEAIPRCGADLVGYFAPHEGSAATAYGVYHVESAGGLRGLPRPPRRRSAGPGELRLC